MLRLSNIVKSFGNTVAVNDASLDVEKGELICLLGPSGCGKSTFLRVIAGLAESDSGTIAINNHDVTRLAANRRPTAMVFQSHALWNHMSVERNIAFGLRVRGIVKAEITERVSDALQLVGLVGYGKRKPSQLSGGQAQRIALARCLVIEPEILLMDEPFSALDAHLRQNLRVELKQLQRRLGLTTIFVTHDQEEAMELADRIVVMSEGKIEQVGTPTELYTRPLTIRVAKFIGTMNICETDTRSGFATWHGLRLPLEASDGPITILTRPEDLEKTSDGPEFLVKEVTDLGPLVKVILQHDSDPAVAWTCSRGEAPSLRSTIKIMPRNYLFYRDGIFVGAETVEKTVKNVRAVQRKMLL